MPALTSPQFDTRNIGLQHYRDAFIRNAGPQDRRGRYTTGHLQGMTPAEAEQWIFKQWNLMNPTDRASMTSKLATVYGTPLPGAGVQPGGVQPMPMPGQGQDLVKMGQGASQGAQNPVMHPLDVRPAGQSPAPASSMTMPVVSPTGPWAQGYQMPKQEVKTGQATGQESKAAGQAPAALPMPKPMTPGKFTNDDKTAARLQGNATYDPNGPHVFDNGKPWSPTSSKTSTSTSTGAEVTNTLPKVEAYAKTMAAAKSTLGAGGQEVKKTGQATGQEVKAALPMPKPLPKIELVDPTTKPQGDAGKVGYTLPTGETMTKGEIGQERMAAGMKRAAASLMPLPDPKKKRPA